MNKSIFAAATFCVCLMASCVFGNAFYMDLNLTPDQQGFDIIPSEGTVQTTTSPTLFTFHAEPGRNKERYANYPGGAAGQAFEVNLTAKLSGRGALGFSVGDYRMSISRDPVHNVFAVFVYDYINEVYVGQSGYIDFSVTHEYRVEVDASGDFSVFVDDDEAITGSGWTNGDLGMVFNGDFSYAMYTADAEIYECSYIPEPATLLLLGLGGLVLRKRK